MSVAEEGVIQMNEFRIKYRTAGCVRESYHYYLADDAGQAVGFQNTMNENKGLNLQILSIERKCPYMDRWVDESDQVKISGNGAGE